MKKIIVMILLALSFLSCGDSKEIEAVKNGTLNGYPHKTLGKAIDGFVGNPKWEEIKAEDGNKYINISGKIEYYKKETNILLQYKVKDNSFEFNALEFNDIPQNIFIYNALIEKMYE